MNQLLRDTSNLVVFATVVQSGSITHGADRLGLERTTVSRRIRDFERALGAKLLDRSSRCVTVTDIGRLCYRHSLRVIQAAEDAAAAARGTEIRAPLSVAAPTAIMETLADVVSRDFEAAFPGVPVELELADEFRADGSLGVDFAVHVGTPPGDAAGFVAERIASVRQCVVASPGYLARTASLVLPRDLAQHRWIGYGASRTELALQLRDGETTRTLGVIPNQTVANLATARQAATAGLGLCVLPEFACQPWLDQGALCRSIDEVTAAPIDVHILHSSSRPLRTTASALADFLARELRG